MTWQNEMVRIVRFLVDDLDSQNYTDARLEETLLVAAQLQYASIDFDNTYSIDVDTLVLTPDPTETDPKDDWFINIVCVKAACIILHSEAKTLATQSYVIKDGPSSIDAKNVFKSVSQLAKDMCEKLDRMVMEYKTTGGSGGQAILTPYTQEYLSDGNPIRNFS